MSSATLKRLLREPLLIFFVLGALLFLLHRLIGGDPRTIVVTPGVRAELERQLRDTNGRAPDAAEKEAALQRWVRAEALYREALREGLDRDDPNVRNVLVEKIQIRRAMEAPRHEPSQAELDAWLAEHRSLYESPPRYMIEWIVFSKEAAAAKGTSPATERESFLHAWGKGANERFLGQTIYGATLTAEGLREKLGATVADALPGLPLEKWQQTSNGDELLLVRVKDVEGGLPPLDELRPRLVADVMHAQQEAGMERAVQAIVGRYKVEGLR